MNARESRAECKRKSNSKQCQGLRALYVCICGYVRVRFAGFLDFCLRRGAPEMREISRHTARRTCTFGQNFGIGRRVESEAYDMVSENTAVRFVNIFI